MGNALLCHTRSVRHSRLAIFAKSLGEFTEALLLDRSAYPGHQLLIVVQVVDSIEAGTEDFAAFG